MKWILAFTLGLIAVQPAHAGQRYKAVEQHAVYCHDIGDAKQHGGPSCTELSNDQSFELVYPGRPSTTSPNEIWDISGTSDARYAYIDGPLAPTNDPAPAHDLCSPGEKGPGGEVDRMVMSKDGTLKLKRFMVTTECVNGHFKSTSRALN